MNVMVDSNVLLDCLLMREPFYEDARKLVTLGILREFHLWMSGAQVNDVFYVLTEGGKPCLAEEAKHRLKELRKGVHVCALGEEEVDAVLGSRWSDLEDGCVYQSALRVGAQFIVTRNNADFELSSIQVGDPREFFGWLAREKGLVYDEIEFL